MNPSLDISQYAHTAWTIRDGFSLGNIYAIAQTPDGYLWLGGEFGLFRFDGVHSLPWQPLAGQDLGDKAVNRLLGARDGTLWIGTFGSLFTLSGGKLMARPEFPYMVDSLVEDRDGTVWAGSYGSGVGTPGGRLCAIRSGGTQCDGEDGAFGRTVSALYEDGSGDLWAGARSGLWRIRPGPTHRYVTPPLGLSGIAADDSGRLVIAMYGAGLMQLAGDKLESYPVRGAATNSNRLLQDRDVNSNKLLRDRDGGLWIGTVERGLLHLHHGRTDVFTRSDGLSGNVILSLFEDREGSIWAATTGGLDRFRELPITTVSVKQGLSSDACDSVLAARDGSIWVGAHDGLTKWTNGRTTIFRKASGLPDDEAQSLFEDDHERLWVSTRHGLAYFKDGRFLALDGIPGGDVHFITGDNTGNLWLSEDSRLLHRVGGRLVEQIPWSEVGRRQSAEVLLFGNEPGGVWLGFWMDGGVSYFKDRRLRASYTAANGLAGGVVADLRLGRDGALWASTAEGLSRVKDGRITTLTSRNGLPCHAIHWTIEDDDRSLWLYMACGMVRVSRTELDAWIADPKRRIETEVWDAADGVKLRPVAASAYGPRVAKAADGKLWFVTGEGVQVADPRHLAVNKLPPPVHIEQVRADGRAYQLKQGMRLPANVRDVSIEFTALSLVAPEKVRFKYMLEGQDSDWKEVINERHAPYSNLRPRKYSFRVIACNNSGVWNATGDTLEFSIEPRFYQTSWFVAACGAVFLAMVWGLFRYRMHQLEREFNTRTEERVEERARIARELHDTLLQSFQGLMFSFQAARNLLPGRTEEATRTLDAAIHEGDQAIAEGRDAIQGLRANPALESNLEHLLTAAAKEFRRSFSAGGEASAFRVTVEGARQPLSPLLQDEVYRIAREILRNAFRHAGGSRIEAETVYYGQFFRLRIRDDGKGIDPKVLEQGARQGHWGLPGVREREKRIGARLKLWSEPGAGTEAELTVPARIAYPTAHRRRGLWLFRRSKAQS